MLTQTEPVGQAGGAVVVIRVEVVRIFVEVDELVHE
jgi:hypothetical protein